MAGVFQVIKDGVTRVVGIREHGMNFFYVAAAIRFILAIDIASIKYVQTCEDDHGPTRPTRADTTETNTGTRSVEMSSVYIYQYASTRLRPSRRL